MLIRDVLNGLFFASLKLQNGMVLRNGHRDKSRVESYNIMPLLFHMVCMPHEAIDPYGLLYASFHSAKDIASPCL
jgi:hypothetical protein